VTAGPNIVGDPVEESSAIRYPLRSADAGLSNDAPDSLVRALLLAEWPVKDTAPISSPSYPITSPISCVFHVRTSQALIRRALGRLRHLPGTKNRAEHRSRFEHRHIGGSTAPTPKPDVRCLGLVLQGENVSFWSPSGDHKIKLGQYFRIC
jgi:hypothetical protein